MKDELQIANTIRKAAGKVDFEVRCLTCNTPNCHQLGKIVNPKVYKAYCCLDLPIEFIKMPIGKWQCVLCASQQHTYGVSN